ncbi:MAG: ABC transporter permease [Euryarchaeota archaeon]|nr:ABC transporter permease [Euryarchaeota archaeon]
MYQLAFKNLLRRKSRTLLALLGIAIGIAMIVSLVSISEGVKARTSEFTRTLGINIEIVQRDASQSSSEIDMDIIGKVEAIPGITAAAPEVYANVDIKGVQIERVRMGMGPPRASNRITLVGIDPVREQMIEGFPTKIIEGRLFEKGKTGISVIGKALADATNKKVGDDITITADEKEYTFTIIGIYETGSPLQDNFIVIPLKEAQKIKGFKSDSISVILAKPASPELVDTLARKIKVLVSGVEPRYTRQMTEQISTFTGQMELMTWVIAGIAAIIGGIGVANTMLMSVIERTREIGVLKAVGWYSSDVLKLILLESLIISAFGATAGLGIGALFTFYLLPAVFPSFMRPLITLDLLLEAVAFALVLGLTGGLYPAMRAARMSPIQAFSEE